MLGRRLARLDLDSISTALHVGHRRRSRPAGADRRAKLLDGGAELVDPADARAGRLANGSADENRDLALVVSDRIRAVGRSFHLGRRPTEFFSFVFPEHALRRGRNRVEVLEVVDGGHSRAAGRQSRRRAVGRVGTGAAALRRAPAPDEQAFVNSW